MTKVVTTDWKHHIYFWGHIAKATVYITVGILALAAVIGRMGSAKGPQRIATYLQDEPLGKVVLVILAIGLFAYCIWRFYKAATDEAKDGSGLSGLYWRAGYAISGVMYGLLGLYIVTLLSSGDTEGNKQDMIVGIMQSGYGVWLIALLAGIALSAAFRQFHQVRTEAYMDDMQTSKMADKEEKTYRLMGKVGYASRIVVYLVLAYSLIRVAITGDPSRYDGIGGVLNDVYRGGGVWLMVLLSIGLLLYGGFVLIKSWYRQVD